MTSCMALIPARYGSTRLPAKALLKKTGKYLVQHVYERVAAARRVDDLVVATDDERIIGAVRKFGGRAVMTSTAHKSGSDRVAEAAAGTEADIILNVQGDEPEIDPFLLDRLIESLAGSPGLGIMTAAVPILDPALYRDPNTVKVVVRGEPGGAARSAGGEIFAGNAPPPARALYFSRAPIPYGAFAAEDGGKGIRPLKHIGVYAFRREALFAFTSLPPSPLERTERLEQNRALDNGMEIGVIITAKDSQGIDTPEDYQAFVERYAHRKTSFGERG